MLAKNKEILHGKLPLQAFSPQLSAFYRFALQTRYALKCQFHSDLLEIVTKISSSKGVLCMKIRHMLVMMAFGRGARKEPGIVSRIFGLALMFLSGCAAIASGVMLGSVFLAIMGIGFLITVPLYIAHRIRKNRYRW